MTLQQGLAFAVILGMMGFFVWGRYRYDLVALCALAVSVVVGIVPAKEAFFGYSDDIEAAIRAIEDVCAQHEKVLDHPETVVRVHELGDNSVNIVVRPWARTVDYWDVYWDLMRGVKERFDAEGISIPFPQRDLHVPGTIEVRMAP